MSICRFRLSEALKSYKAGTGMRKMTTDKVSKPQTCRRESCSPPLVSLLAVSAFTFSHKKSQNWIEETLDYAYVKLIRSLLFVLPSVPLKSACVRVCESSHSVSHVSVYQHGFD